MKLYSQGWLMITLLGRSTGCRIVIRPPPVLPKPSLPSPPAPASPSCQCGTSTSPLERVRIVGGEPADKHQFPWQVTPHISHLANIVSPSSLYCQAALTYKLTSRPFCGGSLLTSTTVLTAAHCQTLLLLFRVVLAEHDVTAADGELVLPPLQWTSHPQYDERQELNNSCSLV